MATNALQVQYRKEFIAGFAQQETLLRKTVTTEARMMAGSAVFLVANMTGVAVTRGANSMIPANPSDLSQYTVPLTEWNYLVRRTDFDLTTNQGDGRRIAQEETRGAINRAIDASILAELDLATQDTGAAVTASLELLTYGIAILGANSVPIDNNISVVVSPAAFAYLLRQPEFTSVDWINNKPFSNGLTAFRWAGMNFIVHPNLPGAGTATERMFMYHKGAIGHAFDVDSVSVASGMDEEQNYFFARSTGYMGSKLLQNKGVVVLNHNGSGLEAQ